MLIFVVYLQSIQIYIFKGRISCFMFFPLCLSVLVYLVSCLETPKRRRVLKKMNGRRISELQPMGKTLQLLAKLLTDTSYKVAVSATSCLCRASGYKSFREKVSNKQHTTTYVCSKIFIFVYFSS